MIQILYTFIGVLIAFGVILLIGYLDSYNSRVNILENKITRLDAQLKCHIDDDDLHERKIPYRNNSYQYAPYRTPYYGSDSDIPDLKRRVTQLNGRVNDILDELDSLKLKWEEEFDLKNAENENTEELEEDTE